MLSNSKLIFDADALREKLQEFYTSGEYAKGVEFLDGIEVGVESINPPYGVYEADEDQQDTMSILSEEGRVWTETRNNTLAMIAYEKGRLYQAAEDFANSAELYKKALSYLDINKVPGEGVYNRVIVQLRLDQVEEKIK